MKVCVVGSGGREHALAHVLGRTAEVVVTPGNPGHPRLDRPRRRTRRARRRPGRRRPGGAAGRRPRRPSCGPPGAWSSAPGADGARLEGSKAWMKELLGAAGVPTARFAAFTEAKPALDYLATLPAALRREDRRPGRRQGRARHRRPRRGRRRRARQAGRHRVRRRRPPGGDRGGAGRARAVDPRRVRRHAGRRPRPGAGLQAHRRGDAGPNTGGMGAYSPVPSVGDDGGRPR